MDDQERRIIEAEDTIEKLREAVHGNGSDGLKARLAALEATVRANSRLSWLIVGGLVVNLLAQIVK